MEEGSERGCEGERGSEEGNEEGGGGGDVRGEGGGWEIKYYIIILELDSCWQPHCLATRLSTRTSYTCMRKMKETPPTITRRTKSSSDVSVVTRGSNRELSF